MTDPTSESTDDRILDRLDTVGKSVETLTTAIEDESSTRRESNKWNRWAIVGAVIVALLGVGVGAWGVTVAVGAGNRADDAAASASAAQRAADAAQRSADRAAGSLAEFKAQTKQARIASCVNGNAAEIKQATAEKVESADTIAALVAAAGNAPDAQRSAAVFDERHDKLIDAAHSLRDCSPAGIRKYLNQSKP